MISKKKPPQRARRDILRQKPTPQVGENKTTFRLRAVDWLVRKYPGSSATQLYVLYVKEWGETSLKTFHGSLGILRAREDIIDHRDDPTDGRRVRWYPRRMS